MSKEGKLRRGEQYHKMRDIDGNYPPGILNNPAKMADLNFYLESLEPEPVEEPKKGRPKKGE